MHLNKVKSFTNIPVFKQADLPDRLSLEMTILLNDETAIRILLPVSSEDDPWAADKMSVTVRRTLWDAEVGPPARQVLKYVHNSPIYDEYQTQSAKVLALLWKRAHQDDSNDTPQPTYEFQVDFRLLWIKAYPGLS